MKPEKLSSVDFGIVTKGPGNQWGLWYFTPKSIARELQLDLPTIQALLQADAALGLLNGLGLLIADIYSLLGWYLAQETLASSRIGGTEASLSDVLVAEANASDCQQTMAQRWSVI